MKVGPVKYTKWQASEAATQSKNVKQLQARLENYDQNAVFWGSFFFPFHSISFLFVVCLSLLVYLTAQPGLGVARITKHTWLFSLRTSNFLPENLFRVAY